MNTKKTILIGFIFCSSLFLAGCVEIPSLGKDKLSSDQEEKIVLPKTESAVDQASNTEQAIDTALEELDQAFIEDEETVFPDDLSDKSLGL